MRSLAVVLAVVGLAAAGGPLWLLPFVLWIGLAVVARA